MCTAATYQTKDHYFGRNLDLEYSYNETVTITPRNYPFIYRCERPIGEHYAMIGMALLQDGYPLYYDASNEKGLSMAGLNFPGNAVYHDHKAQMYNITPFEFIPWILGQCKTVDDAKQLLNKTNLINIPFSVELPLTPLHWIIADTSSSITVEPLDDGLKVYDNPVGILTNNPPFDYHMHNLKNYLNLTSGEPTNRFSSAITLEPYSRGMGAIGLPGDLSSASRFVRAVFTKTNSRSEDSENASICQFFHILGSVAQQNGCVRIGDGFEKTVYSSCCNVDKGVYYYTTYENSQVTAVHLHHENLDAATPVCYALRKTLQIYTEN